MIASMTKNPRDQPHERLSQLLPTIKCSTCLQPVPLDQLDDHTCILPPPIPSIPKSVIPSSERLPARIPSPAISVRSTASSNHLQPTSSPPRQESNRLRIDAVPRVPSPTPSKFRSSPLARSSGVDAADRQSTSSPKPGLSIRDTNHIHPSLPSSPLRTRADSPAPTNINHNNNNGGSTPSTARPNLSFNQEYTTARESGPPRIRVPQLGLPPGQKQGMSLPPGAPGSVGPQTQHRPQESINMQVRPSTTNDVPFPRRPSVPGSHNNGGMPSPPSGGYPRRLGPGPMISVPAPPPPRGMMLGDGPYQGGSPSPRLATASFPPGRPDDTMKSGEAFIPAIERGIDTSSGGEAGMAGVGRRGFAAAARAAMFVGQGSGSMGPPLHYNRKQMMPQHLDLRAASRQITETPPLSAGSGYSSSLSPGPMSPLPQPETIFSQQQSQQPALIHRTPSPGQQHYDATIPIPIKTLGPFSIPPSGPQTNVIGNGNNNGNVADSVLPHLPFFEKYKNSKLGSIDQADKLAPPNDMDTPATNLLDRYMTHPMSQSSHSASASVSTSSASKRRGITADPSSSAESDYSGLAYANSTDYEDDEDDHRGRTLTSPRGAPLKESILRSISSNSKVQFGSVSERSRSNDSISRVKARAARSTLRSEAQSESYPNSNSHADRSRNNSVSSSYSSNADSEDRNRTRSNSSVIALALGLSQTPPGEYRKLGGPGVHNVEGRLTRSGSGRNINGQVERSRSGTNEREREKQVTPALSARALIKQVSGSAASSSSGLSIALRERARDEDEINNFLNLTLHLGPKAKAQRSNTVQGVVQVQSPDLKSVKLPARAQSEREKEKSVGSIGEGKSGPGLPRKEKVKKPKMCLKCAIAIENVRWISTDGGGVLCEKCWKNMYLPKCRRCNLPIERQAVSSSDGQLKGKYHKECFNCHECQKPFPDKTFYVYDGKPLCAYHYHEANDSLCSAARCGQPIEGPCAVSHTGDRYHPEHMTCEYPGSECVETLKEYWEVEGRMLCERHAMYASRVGGNDDEEKWNIGKKEMKRVTRFIDLTGGGITPPASNKSENGRSDAGDSSGLR